MNRCLLCSRMLNRRVDLSFILSFQRAQPQLLCHNCRNQLVNLQERKVCVSCGRLANQLQCSDCQKWNDQFNNQALFQYNAFMKEFFQRYKFQGDYWLRKAFCNDFINFIQSLVKEDEHLVPIPVDQGTIKVRGFNQVAGLIEGLEFEPVLISQRSEQARHHFQRSRRERLQRENPFRVVEPNKVAGAKWVIIDDIYTTGVTVRQAERELSKHGARQVRSITLCR